MTEYKKKIIAVDFDGTLCEDKYPEIGKPIEKTIDFIRRNRDGIKLILWTCRRGHRLLEAIEWCYDHGIKFDAVNQNLPEVIETYGGDTRKVFADIYIDDKMCMNNVL